jgi:DNA polymerase III epsilon subunit-like protein
MICIDIEASGTNYEKHSIVSLGAVDLGNPERRFYGECRIWDGAHIMEDALKVNGYTEASITDPNKQSEAELVRAFLEWTKQMSDRTLAGQNISFDRDMVRAACDRADLEYDLAYRTIDTHTLCYMHIIKSGLPAPIDIQHRRSSLNLDGVLNYCGIPDEPEPHNALTGALCHAEVVSRLIYDKKLLPEFAHCEIPWLT